MIEKISWQILTTFYSELRQARFTVEEEETTIEIKSICLDISKLQLS